MLHGKCTQINNLKHPIYKFFCRCGHCQQFAPEYKKLASAVKGFFHVGAVDASEHQSLGGRFGVQGFPTVKIFGLNKNKPEDYKGKWVWPYYYLLMCMYMHFVQSNIHIYICCVYLSMH